jgi:hypothetical protein
MTSGEVLPDLKLDQLARRLGDTAALLGVLPGSRKQVVGAHHAHRPEVSAPADV